MNRFFENLKREAEQNPTMAMAIGTAFMAAAGKLIQSYGESAGSRAYAKQVNHRIKMDRRRRPR